MVSSIGWQTMTDINNSTKEQFSLHHTELQSMLVESVSDCKSSNHIVIISATLIDDERVQRREKVVRCLSLLHWLHTWVLLFMTQALVLGSVSHMEHGYWQPPEQLIHKDAIPHLQVVKELSALWLVSGWQEQVSDWLMLDTSEPWIQAVGDNFCIWLRFGRDAKH